jgi:hypothetical protein
MAHTIQFVSGDGVLIVHNGTAAQAITLDILVDTAAQGQSTEKSMGAQSRSTRLTEAGTLLVPRMSEGRVVEYDMEGRELWSVQAPSPYSAIRLANGNTLISGGATAYVREVDRKGETVWDFTQKDIAHIDLGMIQGVSRWPNGNTVICNWCPRALRNAEGSPATMQVLEITPAKEVVWEIRCGFAPQAGRRGESPGCVGGSNRPTG